MLSTIEQLLHRPPLAQPAFIRGAQSCGWPEFLRQIQGWYQTLQQSPAPCFALYHQDSREFAAAVLAACAQSRPLYLLADASHSSQGGLPPGCQLLGDLPQALLAQPSAISLPNEPLDPEHIRLYLYTSGSQGEPLAVAKNLRQLDSELQSLERLWGEQLGPHRVLSTVPHQHLYGLLFSVLWPLLAGRPVVQASFALPDAWLDELTRAPAILVTSPALLKRLAPPAGRLPAPVLVFSSGSPLAYPVAQDCLNRWGLLPWEIYGSSETGGIGIRQQSTPDAAFQPLPGVRLRLNQGLLSVQSPHLPDRSDWFQSADRAQDLADLQQFRLLGRADRLVKLEDKRLSLDRIEALLAQSPLVAQVRLLVLEQPRQQLAAVIRPTASGAELLATSKTRLDQALRQSLQGLLEPLMIPRRFRYVDTWPSNRLGKTSFQELATLFNTLLPSHQILVQQADRLELDLLLDSALAAFDGHFPGNPILPGVSQIDWVMQFGQTLLPAGAKFQRMEQVKFQQVLRPGLRVRLELDWNAGSQRLGFCYRSDLGLHSQGRIQLGCG